MICEVGARGATIPVGAFYPTLVERGYVVAGSKAPGNLQRAVTITGVGDNSAEPAGLFCDFPRVATEQEKASVGNWARDSAERIEITVSATAADDGTRAGPQNVASKITVNSAPGSNASSRVGAGGGAPASSSTSIGIWPQTFQSGEQLFGGVWLGHPQRLRRCPSSED